jgi:uncharacterized protein with HEPN domain
MKEDAIKRLHDAFEAANRLQRIGASYTRDAFLKDDILQLAVWKLVEIVGEALHQAELIESDLEDLIPDLRRVIDTRNRITHGYDSVNFSLLWDIATNHIDALVDDLEKLLAAQEPA